MQFLIIAYDGTDGEAQARRSAARPVTSTKRRRCWLAAMYS